MKSPVTLVLAALVVTALGGAARADLITWTLTGFALDDGGSAFGSFQVNTVTHQITAWDITTTAGTTLPGYHYSSALPNQNFSNYSASSVIVDDAAANGNEIEFTFNDSFGTPSANNTIFPAGSYEFERSTNSYRFPTAGAADAFANPGPLPGGGLLSYLIAGFGGLAAWRKKALRWALGLRRRYGFGLASA